MNTMDERRFWESVVHGLRASGWSRIDAEDEADAKVERMRQREAHQKNSLPQKPS